MRLHNRQIKATFWNDPDLLQWPRDKRWFYEGLIQLADDSGCLEDSPFAFKLNLFPSPLDSDITIEVLANWRDELIKQNKLVRYKANGKQYLYLINFHKHQTVKNASEPSVPLPPWIEWKPFESNKKAGKYLINYEVLSELLQSSYKVLNNFFQPEPEPEPEPEIKNNKNNNTTNCGFEASCAPEASDESDVKPQNEVNFNFPEEYWQMIDEIDSLSENEQLNMLVKQYNKKYPGQFRKFKTAGSVKARNTFKTAIEAGIPASEILKEILFDILDEDEPDPAPWDITNGLIKNRGLEQTRAQVYYSMALQLERGVTIGADTTTHRRRDGPTGDGVIQTGDGP